MKIEVMLIVITGLLCITALEIIALANGINGTGLAAAMAAIGAIVAGSFTYILNKIKAKKNGKG